MLTLRNQQTLKQPVIFQGVGVHSGISTRVTVHPAKPGHGIVFTRASHPSTKIMIGTIIPERAMHATVIKAGGWALSTVEHLLAALWILGIDNARIEVDGNEIPILDGSCAPFVEKFLDVGMQDLGCDRQYLTPRGTVAIQDDAGRSIVITPNSSSLGVPSDQMRAISSKSQGTSEWQLTIDYCADFKHPGLGPPQFQGVITPASFITEVAPARTFGFLSQLPYLLQHGLAQGASLDNTIVIVDEPLNALRFPDECVRHKVLDLLGDLSLLGKQLVGNVVARHTSHHFNRLVVEHYLKNPEQWVIVDHS